eukprot:SAG11_NODE_2462_length_3327_cov_2.195167_4_plen_107_part_00
MKGLYRLGPYRKATGERDAVGNAQQPDRKGACHRADGVRRSELHLEVDLGAWMALPQHAMLISQRWLLQWRPSTAEGRGAAANRHLVAMEKSPRMGQNSRCRRELL